MNNERRPAEREEAKNGAGRGGLIYTVVRVWLMICLSVITLTLICGEYAGAQIKLKVKIPDLCYECHKELKNDLTDRYVHFLFKQGKCITCHNAHISNIKGLMHDQIDSVCLGCHKTIRETLDTGTMHSALRDNNCTECHYPHSSENRHLLTTSEQNLCMNCHGEIRDQLEKTYACLPFREGKCSQCHDSHGSSEDNLLIADPNTLCQQCHGPRCRIGDVSIASYVKDSDCTSCHSGHSSDNKGILGPNGHTVFLVKKCHECHNPIVSGKEITTKIEGRKLCQSCHKKSDSKLAYVENDVHVKDIKNPCILCHDHHASGRKNLTKNETKICISCHEKTEKRTASMEKALRSIKCTPVKNRECFECHIPMHSDRQLNYRDDEAAICARCHEAQHKITHPLGEDVIDPRNNKPVTCVSCHSMHAAKAEFMLTHDKNRALCIQCHKM